MLYESAQTGITLPLSPGRTVRFSYDGTRKTSRYVSKGGQLHGEALSYAKPAADGTVAVTKSCFKDGEKIKLDPCNVD
ncbi:MAG: hypothetical protein V4631_12780 [Pseudomonadota bacterium]